MTSEHFKGPIMTKAPDRSGVERDSVAQSQPGYGDSASRDASAGSEPSVAIVPDTEIYPQFEGQRRADVQYIDAALSLYRGPSYRELAFAWLRLIGQLSVRGGAPDYRSDADEPGEIRSGSNVVLS